MIQKLRYWSPPILWMIVIFILSSRHRIVVSQEATLNFLFFKSLHVIEYAFLYFLTFRALTEGKIKNVPPQTYLNAAIITLIYALTDEIHQTFVPTREGRPRDVFIDAIGVTAMYILIHRYLIRIKQLFI